MKERDAAFALFLVSMELVHIHPPVGFAAALVSTFWSDAPHGRGETRESFVRTVGKAVAAFPELLVESRNALKHAIGELDRVEAEIRKRAN